MSKIVVFNFILAPDIYADKILLASLDKENILIPTTNIENPKFLYNEIRYNIKNLFLENSIRFLEEIRISFMDIQNYLLLDMLDMEYNKEKYTNINDDDIIILSGIVLHEKLFSDKINWISINNILTNSNIGITTDPIFNLTKYVFDKVFI